MLFKKIWRTVLMYKTQFISMIIMISLGIGIFLGFNVEWYSIKENVENHFEVTNFADYRIYNEFGFTEDDLIKINENKDVKRASRFLAIDTDVKYKNGKTITLAINENEDISGFIVVDGEKYNKESIDGIWLSKSYAKANNVSVGDKITLIYENVEFKLIVKGLIHAGEYLVNVRDETQLMPDYSTHGYGYISPKMCFDTLGFEYYPQINVLSSLDKSQFKDIVKKVFGKTLIILSKDENVSYAGCKGEIKEGKTMGSILPAIFLFVASLTMVTTMHRLVVKEKSQIGTLKALGFKDRRIVLHYTFYSFMVAIIGAVFGLGLGHIIASFILKPSGAMMVYLDVPDFKLYMPDFCIVLLIVMVLSLTLIGYLSVYKMLKTPAAETLRPYTPKNIKKVFFEDIDFWDKLGFGAKWNIRDSLRHKSRTFMSIVGVIGCAGIVIASLGINDTMDAFLELNYNKAMLYNSKINLVKSISQDNINNLIEKYNGDSSASIHGQIEDKAISIDIYNLENNYVRFNNIDNRFEELKDNGAYISLRIAKEFDLEVGDSFSITLYGSDKTYMLKINGIIRSLSESVVITSKYAGKLNLPYSIDTIYTETVSNEIFLEDSILNVQSKQALIDTFDRFLEIMNLIITILIIIAIILGIVVLYNLGIMSYTERYKEMATLKVVGFKDKQIAQLLVGQNIGITIIGIVLGIPLGVIILDYLVISLASEYEMTMVLNVATYLICILIIMGMSLFVSFMVARKNKNIDMVEALKGID